MENTIQNNLLHQLNKTNFSPESHAFNVSITEKYGIEEAIEIALENYKSGYKYKRQNIIKKMGDLTNLPFTICAKETTQTSKQLIEA